MAVLVLVAPAWSQDAPEPGIRNGTGFTTPRGSVRANLQAGRAEHWSVAAPHLDLRGLPPRQRETRGPDLAERLKVVLDRTRWIDLERLSDAAEGDTEDGQPEGRDLVGTIQADRGAVRVYVERTESKDGALEWRFSRGIVDRVDELYEEFGSEPALAQHLPAFLYEHRVFGAELWQWLGLALLVVAAALVSLVTSSLVLAMARLVVRRTEAHHDDAIVELAVGPVRLMLGVVAFTAGVHALRLPVNLHGFFVGMARGVFIVAVTWMIIRGVAVVSRVLQLRMAQQGDRVGI
jgi:MscS family membrane protein